MEEEIKGNKLLRVLEIYNRLNNGEVVNKSDEAIHFGVNEKSIQRDIDDIRSYIDMDTGNTGIVDRILYDRVEKGYRLEHVFDKKLRNAEILSICKILLDSRAFTKMEMVSILNRLIDCCVPETSKNLVQRMIGNEEYHYIQPCHGKIIMDMIWNIAMAIEKSLWIEISYQKLKKHEQIKRRLKPLAIIFNEYYFYLIAYSDDKEVVEATKNFAEYVSPVIYRVDRIDELTITNEHFHIPYADRFEEGEFRKRVQFMFGGKLHKVKFRYSGISIEAILDRLPTARVLEENENEWLVEAEAYGRGLEMWLRTQGDNVEIIEDK